MSKLDMPKIDVPSPPQFNVSAHPPPKPAASLLSLVPEFKVLDAAPKFYMPKVNVPLFLMPKFDIPNMPTFVLPKVDVPKFEVPTMPKVDMPATPPTAYKNQNMPRCSLEWFTASTQV